MVQAAQTTGAEVSLLTILIVILVVLLIIYVFKRI